MQVRCVFMQTSVHMEACYIIHTEGVKELMLPEWETSSFEIGPSHTVWLHAHEMADRGKSLRRNMPGTGTHNGKGIWRAQNQSAACQPAFCQTGTCLMWGFPCGQNAVCFVFVWRWADREVSNQIKNNQRVTPSANILVPIMGLIFVSCSVRDLLSKPDKSPF